MILTRRNALKSGIAAALLAGAPKFATARGLGERRFVFILLRGGMDGLAAAPPLGDPDYARLRGALALTERDAPLPLTDRFALHPAMTDAHALYNAGELAIVHAVAPPHKTRSHFDAQNILEGGGVRAFAEKDGWLNRAIQALDGASDAETAVAIAGALPLVMRGKAPVGSWASRRSDATLSPTLAERVRAMYAADPVLAPALEQALATQSMAAGAAGAARPPRPLALSMNAGLAAGMLRRSDGPRIAMLEGGLWDTHAGQGRAEGMMARLLGDLSNAFSRLKDGLGPAWRQTVVVAATEFGRTVRPNGSNGTDHGHGGVAFLAGGAVQGGRVVADWPGLSEGALHEGRDLAATTDLRGLLKGVLGDHLRLSDATLSRDIFPGAAGVRALKDQIKIV